MDQCDSVAKIGNSKVYWPCFQAARMQLTRPIRVATSSFVCLYRDAVRQTGYHVVLDSLIEDFWRFFLDSTGTFIFTGFWGYLRVPVLLSLAMWPSGWKGWEPLL